VTEAQEPQGPDTPDLDAAGSPVDPAAAVAEEETEAGTDLAGEAANDVVADLAGAQAHIAALTDDIKRVQAEYQNYKRRVDRDRELVQENARFSILSALLPVLDDIDRAREHGEVEGGFKAVADSLDRIVAGQGLVKFGAPGDEFDPRFHEALMHAHSSDVTTTTCQHVVKAGYQIGDRVVRAAQVTVVDPVDGDATPDTGESAPTPGA
jgi:molecular chaperone GrpE